MAEIQTVGAAFDLARLALEGCKFLRKVHHADKIVGEVYDRTLRLRRVLDNVGRVLEAREKSGGASDRAVETETVENIDHCVRASQEILLDVEERVGGFDQRTSGPNLVERVKVALRHPSVCRLQSDLEARVSALSADLAILQLFDQANTHATVQHNHEELLETLDDLREKLDSSHEVLRGLKSETFGRSLDQITAGAGVSIEPTSAIRSLRSSIKIGESLHERYSSQWDPDDQSLRHRRGLVADGDTNSAPDSVAPAEDGQDEDRTQGAAGSRSPPESIFDKYEGELELELELELEAYPLEVLDRLIDAATDHAFRARDAGQFNQAENKFQAAISFSRERERHYHVPFTDRVRLEEEVVQMYQKQGQHLDAVKKLRHMLSEATDDWTKARQNYLLASVYFDRHQSRNGAASSHSTADIDKAECHARNAFSKQFKLLADSGRDDASQRYIMYTELLIKVTETKDQSIDTNVLRELLTEVDPSRASDSMRRISSLCGSADGVVVRDRHNQLITAIKDGDIGQVERLLEEGNINIEQRCDHGNTALFAAVESADETMVHKLLNPNVGANVNARNHRERTVLHRASALGLHDMVRCLLHHDADIEAQDERGHTPLLAAVRAGQTLMVQVLFDRNASIEAKNVDESSALHLAVRLQNTDMLTQLLDLGPDLKDAVDLYGKTALHLCAELELVNQARELLTHTHHLDISAVDSCNRSALFFAASKPSTPKRESMVQLLVQQGARIDPMRHPPRWRDYAALNHFQVPRRLSRASTLDSVRTEGTVGTVSTNQSKPSRKWSIWSRS